MLILRNESEIHRITNPAIRQLMALRFLQLNATDDPDAPDAGHVEFIVVEAGDQRLIVEVLGERRPVDDPRGDNPDRDDRVP